MCLVPTTPMLAEVGYISNAQYSDRDVDDSPKDSSDRASQLKVLIQWESRGCLSAIDN